MSTKKRDAILAALISADLADFTHAGDGLLSHLKGTGLCHSIYGTESYRKSPLSVFERDLVKELIGEKAERFVYYFGCHIKDSL